MRADGGHFAFIRCDSVGTGEPVLTLQVESFFHLDNAFVGALSMNMRPWRCLNIYMTVKTVNFMVFLLG